MVLYALTTGHKIGLGAMAGAFIVLALVAALVVPRLRPDFPGRGLRPFLLAALTLTVGMLLAVVILGREPKEKKAEAATTSTPANTSPANAPPPPAGDPAAGKKLFAAQGCGACHTFTPAGSKAKIGPDLDNLAAGARKANRGSLDQYTRESIADPNAYVVPGFPKGVMPPFGKTLSASQIADLVAFLTQK